MKVLFKDPTFLLILLSVIAVFTSYVNAVTIFAILLVTDIAIIFNDGLSILNRRGIRILSLFYIIEILYSCLGHGRLDPYMFKTWIFSVASMYSALIISQHLTKLEKKQIDILLAISLLSVFVGLAVTTYICKINPMAVRMYGFGDFEAGDWTEASYYYRIGMINYSMAHSLTVIAAGLCALACLAKKMWLRGGCLFAFLVIIKLQFNMTITTALILSFICGITIFAYWLSKGRWINMLVIMGILVALALSVNVISSFMDFTGGRNEDIFYKFDDLFSSVRQGSTQGQMDYRNYLYTTSFNTFMKNPIFGWGVDNGSRTVIGEHSFLLDYLAYYGVFAFLFFSAWWKEYRSFTIEIGQKYKGYYYLAFLPVVFLVILKAQSVASSLCFVSLVFIRVVFIYIQKCNSNYSPIPQQ